MVALKSKAIRGIGPAIIAISANTLMLKQAQRFGIAAESGGLLKLHVIYLGPLLHRIGADAVWQSLHLPGLQSLWFWLGFHYATGLAMAFIYIYVLEPILPGGGFLKGSLFSLLPWALNSLGVLPLLGQGVLGRNKLTVGGMVYFFAANWLFGALLGVFYARGIRSRSEEK